jgi:folate-dependent phosphoribosylglycinamide formyltransferase PurN
LNSRSLKVGVLLNSLVVPSWVAEIIQFLQNDYRFKICFVAVNQSTPKKQKNISVYKLLRKVDERIMKMDQSPFKRKSISLSGVPHISVLPIQKKYSDYFSTEIVKEIQSYDVDIILRFGFRILRGEILNSAKFGILSLHHGDVETYRGGPPAFWEVFHNYPVTGVSLQVLTENLDAGKIIERCFLNTYPFSFYRNQHRVYWAGEKMFKEQLSKIADVGPIAYFQTIKPLIINPSLEKNFFKSPKNIQSLYILIWYLWNNIYRKVYKYLFPLRWQIIHSKYDTESSNKKVLSQYKLIPPKDREWADPYIISKDTYFYIFLEEKLINKKNAHISVIRSDFKGQFIDQKPIPILVENVHLSYPFVFPYLGEYYMLTESSESRLLNLYKAESFPLKWNKIKTIISDMMIYDPTLYQHSDGIWYLFCTAKHKNVYSSNAYLHIFYTDDLLNKEFTPHPMNPIYSDVRCSRSAGSIMHIKGKTYRPYQICAPFYGNGMNYAEVKMLSTTEYQEELLDSFEYFQGLDLKKSHTLNSSEEFVVTDELSQV